MAPWVFAAKPLHRRVEVGLRRHHAHLLHHGHVHCWVHPHLAHHALHHCHPHWCLLGSSHLPGILAVTVPPTPALLVLVLAFVFLPVLRRVSPRGAAAASPLPPSPGSAFPPASPRPTAVAVPLVLWLGDVVDWRLLRPVVAGRVVAVVVAPIFPPPLRRAQPRARAAPRLRPVPSATAPCMAAATLSRWRGRLVDGRGRGDCIVPRHRSAPGCATGGRCIDGALHWFQGPRTLGPAPGRGRAPFPLRPPPPPRRRKRLSCD
mmetsp:Transcript_73219/g.207031  ORF Transcript_73219/g.207031 Transcript_73219/m.207031 type:complete len:262 (-) Transcript_73219:36-821(-)